MPEPIKQRVEVDYKDKGLKDAARDAKQLGDATDKAADKTQQAGRKEQTRAQRLARMRTELNQLTRQEQRHEQAVRRGAGVDDQAAIASQRRTQRIGRLSRALAISNTNQQRVNASIGNQTKALGLSTQAGAAFTSSITSMATSLVGAGGVIRALQRYEEQIAAVNTRLRENASLTQEFAEARINLAALTGVESDEDLRFFTEVATFAGRDPGEVSRLNTVFKSQFPNRSNEAIKQLIVQTAQFGQLSDSSLVDIGKGLSLLFRQTNDPQQSSNLLFEAIRQAGEPDPSRVVEQLSKFVGVGEKIGGLDTSTAVGFASAGTSLGLPNEIATTGLKNVLFAIRGKGTPEGKKIIDRLNIDQENVIVALQQISDAAQAGELSPADLESLGGREAAPVFAALSDPDKLASFLQSVREIQKAGTNQQSIVFEQAKSVFGSSELQSLNLLIKQQSAETKGRKATDVDALQIKAAREILKNRLDALADQGLITPSDVEAKLKFFDRDLVKAKRNPQFSNEAALVLAAQEAEFAQAGDLFDFKNILTATDFQQLDELVSQGLTSGPNIDPSSIGGRGSVTVNNNQIIIDTQIVNTPEPGDVITNRRDRVLEP